MINSIPKKNQIWYIEAHQVILQTLDLMPFTLIWIDCYKHVACVVHVAQSIHCFVTESTGGYQIGVKEISLSTLKPILYQL